MVDIRRRLMGASAVISPDGKITGVDIDGFVRRLLLFDRYVLVSVRLQEFPFFIDHLGFEGVRELLSENLLEIRCECLQLAQVGQSGMFGDQRLPPYHYKFNWVDAHDRGKYINDCLGCLNSRPGLGRVEIEALRESILKAIRPLSRDIMSRAYPDFVADLMRPRLSEASVKMAAARRIGLIDLPTRLDAHQLSEDTFRIDNDIAAFARITTGEAHRIVEAGLMGIAGLSQTIQEMGVFNALSGFREEEIHLFQEKLSFLAGLASTGKIESDFQRVIEIKNLPNFSSELVGVKIDQLLKVRDSSEAREFRDWLRGSEDLTEKEINDQVAGLRARAGLRTTGNGGKAIRFLLTTIAGVNPVLGLVSGALDTFVYDRFLPRSGIAAFVNELYPSLFEQTLRSKNDDLRIINRS